MCRPIHTLLTEARCLKAPVFFAGSSLPRNYTFSLDLSVSVKTYVKLRVSADELATICRLVSQSSLSRRGKRYTVQSLKTTVLDFITKVFKARDCHHFHGLTLVFILCALSHSLHWDFEPRFRRRECRQFVKSTHPVLRMLQPWLIPKTDRLLRCTMWCLAT